MPLSTAGEQQVAPCCGTMRKSPSAFARQQPSMEVLAVYTWTAKPSFVAGLQKTNRQFGQPPASPVSWGYSQQCLAGFRQQSVTPAGATDREQAAHEIGGVLWDAEWSPPLQCPHNHSSNSLCLCKHACCRNRASHAQL